MKLEDVRRLATFGAVGAFNTVAFFLIANVLSRFVDDSVAAYVSYGILIPVSFLGHRQLTFRSQGLISKEGVRFCISQGLNLALIWIATHTLSGWLAFAMISVLIPILNFLVFQIWVFRSTSAN